MKLCKLVKAPLNLALRKTDLVKSFAVRVILRSKEKGKLSRIYLKIYMKSLCYVEIYRAAQNTGDDFRKNIAFPEGNKQILC